MARFRARNCWHLVVVNCATSKLTEGEVPPAGCAGVVCANETNKKETQVACLFFVADRGGAGEERKGGGGVIYSTQHARSSHKF